MIIPSDITLRHARRDDAHAIEQLYRQVAEIEGGLARSSSEITPDYIQSFVAKSHTNGVEWVALQTSTEMMIGEIHCYRNGLQTFEHLLTDLTIAVHPAFQGRGVGRLLFTALLTDVTTNRPDVLRVELIARESNRRAIAFYESLGFKKEGRLRKRIKRSDGTFEDDIVMGWMRT